jgi:hypothetical protein
LSINLSLVSISFDSFSHPDVLIHLSVELTFSRTQGQKPPLKNSVPCRSENLETCSALQSPFSRKSMTDGSTPLHASQLFYQILIDACVVATVVRLLRIELGLEFEAVQDGDRAQDCLESLLVGGVLGGSAQLEHVAAGLDAVDVGEIADMAANL